MRDEAVSEVVGEMIMIALVLLLVSIFAVSLSNCLPTERAPTVTVMMTNTTDSITLHHKGGDWIQVKDLEIIVLNATKSRRYHYDTLHHYDTFLLTPEKQVFDIGSNITVNCNVDGGEKVSLIAPRAVLFTGEVR